MQRIQPLDTKWTSITVIPSASHFVMQLSFVGSLWLILIIELLLLRMYTYVASDRVRCLGPANTICLSLQSVLSPRYCNLVEDIHYPWSYRRQAIVNQTDEVSLSLFIT